MFEKFNLLQIILLFFLGLFFISVGFFIGYYFQNNISEKSDIILFKNIERNIPIINLHQIENGILEITRLRDKNLNSLGEVRIFINADEKKLKNAKDFYIFSDERNSIQLDISKILPKIEKIPSPNLARFVASKRGSIFWPLDHPKAFILSVENRVFFNTVGEAVNAGYKKGIK
jgi:hypothetical protein